MIIGVGVDIIEIDRIKQAMERNKNFLLEIFTQNEIEYFKSRKFNPEHIAGRFAAKEAVAKSIGTGFREFAIKDIEIDRNSLGKPLVVLHGKLKQKMKRSNACKFHVSISHDKSTAIAYALLEEL